MSAMALGLALSMGLRGAAQAPPAAQPAPAQPAPAPAPAQPAPQPAPPPVSRQPAPVQPGPAQPQQGAHGEAVPPPRPAGGPQEAPRFPAHQRPPAPPEQLERGKAQYAAACSACHGADARGGQLGGPNLLRSQLVLDDKDGELITPVVLNGRPGPPPMPPIPIAVDEIKAIAAWLHSLQAQGTNQGGPPPGPETELNILVGDAKAGQTFFAAKCASCHSPTGDLQGLATRVTSPMALQNMWVSGGVARPRGARRAGPPPAAKPVTATVTLASGEKLSGRLARLDDFLVTLMLEDGTQRTIPRRGATPKIDVQDPLAPHRALLGVLTNANMHDVTAYLVTLK
jgi:cytochrome c oxidase cbb3-type subunit 3